MGKSIEEWKIGDPMINERDYWQDPNYVAPDKEKEKMVLKLASIITDRYVKKFTGTINNRDPEYWMLDMILTKEQVRFLLNFKKTRVPYTIRELARINKMSIKHTKDMVKELCWIGVVEMTREGEDKHKEYNLPIFVPGSARRHHPDGPRGRLRYRHACHPGREGHQHGEQIRLHRTSLPLA